jgi:hypothetical protein
MNADVDLFVTTFLKALVSQQTPLPVQFDGEPCLLVQGDLSAILLIFDNEDHRNHFLESVEQARRGHERLNRVDPGRIYGPRGIIAMTPGARIDRQWQALKAGTTMASLWPSDGERGREFSPKTRSSG